jgi:nitrogen-specific signal transduction histidine kinase
VSRIVDQYNGVIRFSSTPGNTEFLVRLPSEAVAGKDISKA